MFHAVPPEEDLAVFAAFAAASPVKVRNGSYAENNVTVAPSASGFFP